MALVEPFREAVRAELAPERYPLMPAKKLAQRSGCQSEETLRTGILRLRKKLEEFAKTSGRPPLPIDAIIENLSWRGYRLNPQCVRLVSLQPPPDDAAADARPTPPTGGSLAKRRRNQPSADRQHRSSR